MSILRETSIVPRGTLKFLATFGGKNPYGEPIWRLVVASDVWIKRWGVYRDWDKNLSVAERGGLNLEFSPDRVAAVNADFGGQTVSLGEAAPVDVMHYNNKPEREVVECREVHLYPNLKGWVVEKWFPAGSKMIGSREEWESYKAADGMTSINGEYPERGEYVMIYGPYNYLPTEDQLRTWIGKYHNDLNLLTGTVEQRALAADAEFNDVEDEKWKKNRAEYNYMMADVWKTVAKSGSLGISRFRQQLAKQAGVTEHIGIL
jgi:hypothetical protein